MSKVMWPMGRDNPNCICGENPNINCDVHVTKSPSPNTNIDDLDKIILGLINWVDSQHIPSNNGSYRLTREEAKTQLQALLSAAKIEELKNFPRTRSYRGYIENRIKELEEK